MAEKSQKLGRFSSFFLFKERNWLFGNWNARTEDDILRSFPTWNWNWIIGIFNIEQHYQVVEFLYGRDTIKIPRKFPNFEIETGLSRLRIEFFWAKNLPEKVDNFIWWGRQTLSARSCCCCCKWWERGGERHFVRLLLWFCFGFHFFSWTDGRLCFLFERAGSFSMEKSSKQISE